MTCRHLFNFISNTNLYSALDFLQHKKGAMEVIAKFQDKSSFGALPTIFPNVTQFRVPPQSYDKTAHDPRYLKCPLIKWSTTLRTYDMVNDCPGMLPVLKSTTFPRLTNLISDRSTFLDAASNAFDFNSFLPMIKNAPSLKCLQLHTTINLEFLEELHTSCPDLESLILRYPEIVIKNDVLPHSIIPADNLLYLNIDAAHCFDKRRLFLDYITAKYRCLNQLSISFQQQLRNDGFDLYFNPVDTIAEEMDQDENERAARVARTAEYEYFRVDFEATKVAYGESSTRFFSQLSKSVKHISIYYDTFKNPVLVSHNSITFF